MPLSDELQVVVLASQSTVSGVDSARLQALLAGELNWPAVYSLSQRHNVFPRVWKNLGFLFASTIPQEVNKLQSTFMRRHLLASTTITRSLFAVRELFAENALFNIPYKGPVLASYFYADITQRSYADLDFLIKREDFAKFYQILLAKGYKPELQLSPGTVASYTAVEDNLSFENPRGVCLEIHWELSGKYLIKPFGVDFVGKDLSSTRMLGRELPIFSDENLLIYFCLHGTKHCWDQLDLVACVAELLRKARESMDWSHVLNAVSEYKCRRMLFVGLLLALKIYQATIPREIQDLLVSDKKAILLGEELFAIFCASGDFKQQTENALASKGYLPLRMRIRDSRMDMLRYALRLFFVPSKLEWRTVQLPSLLVWMYYVFRPVRIMFAAVRTGLLGSSRSVP